MLICKFCTKACKNANSHRNHERICPSNLDRVYTNGMKGKTSPMKGQTKETSEEIARQAKTIKDNMANGKTKKPSGGVWTEEMREKQSRAKKELYKAFPEKHPNRKLAGNRNKMSYPEKIAFDWLTEHQISFIHQQEIMGKYVDFLCGNTVIEIDGERFHPLGNEKDSKRDLELNKLGYEIIRIRSKEHIENRLTEIFGVENNVGSNPAFRTK